MYIITKILIKADENVASTNILRDFSSRRFQRLCCNKIKSTNKVSLKNIVIYDA